MKKYNFSGTENRVRYVYKIKSNIAKKKRTNHLCVTHPLLNSLQLTVSQPLEMLFAC